MPRRRRLPCRRWVHSTGVWPSSPAPAGDSGASTPCCSPPRAPRSSSTTSAAPTTAPAPTPSPAQRGRRRDPRRGRRGGRQRRQRRRLGGRPATCQLRHRGVRRSRHPRQQRRHPARPGARQHDRGGVGRRRRACTSRATSPRAAGPPPTGGSRPRAAGPSRATSCTRRARRGCSPTPGQTNYGAAKSGIATFSQIFAKELTRYDVKSNCIAPGRPHPADPGHARPRRDHGGPRRASSTSGTRPTCRRSSPTSARPTARSPARRSSCRAAW